MPHTQRYKTYEGNIQGVLHRVPGENGFFACRETFVDHHTSSPHWHKMSVSCRWPNKIPTRPIIMNALQDILLTSGRLLDLLLVINATTTATAATAPKKWFSPLLSFQAPRLT
ncbi:unnamed protein product [Schistocephalus solidus]|uniref:Uncharacterized protein n=1 Tax=Schistocephalus solidus TaxID=70667 RepID=A0A183SD12_SCHSO|nr:unnamed protein product [Schistocephalus solidus]